jgi:glycosyltransferase involved in cell wall biosynthesis
MSTDKPLRVLLVPDVIWGDNSGAESARFTSSSLHKLGYDVGVYAYEDTSGQKGNSAACNFRFIPRRQSSSFHHFWGGKIRDEFEHVLVDYRPDYVFFVGAAISKPYHLFKACLEKNVPFNLLFYINDYYCSRIYAGLKDGPCFRCINGNYVHAYLNDCLNKRPHIVQFVKSALVLRRLKSVLLKCHKVIGYSDDQLSLYLRYGFATEQCIKSPVHFNNECIQNVESRRGDYFVLCGQSSIEKGWHYMADVVRLCPATHFKFVFPTKEIAEKQSAIFGLQEFVSSGQIEIVTGLQDHDDLMKLLARSRGVLIPSNYPTTGEFVMMESLGLGKPVIVFDAGIHPDIIRSGENGLMANVGNVKDFARHINHLNSDDELYSKLEQGARSLFAELNSFERLAEAAHLALPARNVSLKQGSR